MLTRLADAVQLKVQILDARGKQHDNRWMTPRTKFAIALFGLCLVASAATAQTVLLEHGWQITVDPAGHATLADVERDHQSRWRDVRVGLSWNAQFEDLRDYMGVAWYRTELEVPAFSSPRRVLLRFGAVDYASEVFVNEHSVGNHEGGYTPFAFDVTSYVHPGMNRIAVRVIDPPTHDQANQFPDMRYKEIPHGKQSWYVQTGGIWQPVLADFRPTAYIERIHMSPQLTGDITLNITVAGGQSENVAFTIRDATGRSVATGSEAVNGGVAALRAHVSNPQLWSPESPVLYSVEVALEPGGDIQREHFGFRKLEVRNRKLYLNGEPFYMVAALDQDFYPETIYTPPSKQYVREQMLKGKQLGLNLLRCHIKVCDPVYLEAADETGMLVWYEIPSWNDQSLFTAAAARRAQATLDAMIARDWNHPAIVIQSVINEAWGTDLKQAEQRRWLRATFERAKTATADLGRLIVDNSACCKNFHLKSDLDDFHQYFSIPDNAEKWAEWTADFASRPKWSFSPYGDAERSGKEPLIVSEFGNWGLPQLPSELPWWMDREGGEVTRPKGVLARFTQYNFASLFPTFNDLAEATEWHQFDSLKFEIEDIRRHGSIQGYVITEFTDINWEANGLMDMWRKPKVYAARLRQLQQPDLVLATFPKRNYVPDEAIKLEIIGSHYAPADWTGAHIRWSTEWGTSGTTSIIPPVARSTVATLGNISLRAPQTNAPSKRWISLELVSPAGVVLCGNLYEIFVYPPSQETPKPKIFIQDPAHTLSSLAAALATLHPVVTTPSKDALFISSVLDEFTQEHVRMGGRALILIDSADALPKTGPFAVKARTGSDLDGNWVTNFNWARNDAAPFQAVALGKILGLEAAAVTPRFVLQNVPAAAYNDVLAGIFYGWLNRNGALAVQTRYGNGALLLTTFGFGAYATDPYARKLLDAMIDYTSGTAFNPTLEWNSTVVLRDSAGRR